MRTTLSGRRRASPRLVWRRAYSAACAFPAALLLIAAHKPSPPSGDLALDGANPVIDVEIAGVPMRLRVDLDQQESIALNPAAAARLAVTWEDGMEMDVGRVRLHSRVAPVLLRVQGRELPTQVIDHGRDCCSGSDGAIGPDLLPFATVRWRFGNAPTPSGERTMPLAESAMTGLSAPSEAGKVRLRFALGQPETIGTAAAGGILAKNYSGHWVGEPSRVILAFGVSRPARTIGFERNVPLGGFRFDRLIVRTSDFGGDERLPIDLHDPSDVVVAHRLEPQRGWPAVTLGLDRLSRCAEIVYTAAPRTLSLRCAFDRP